MTNTPAAPPMAEPSASLGRSGIALVVALLVVHAILAWQMRIPFVPTTGDDAAYLTLAQGMHALSYPERWTIGTPPHAMYPPAFPALLAVIGAIGPTDVSRAVILNIGLSVAALALVAMVAHRVAPWLAIAVVAVCALNPLLLSLAGRIYSEPLALALAMATLVAVGPERPARRWMFVAATAAIAMSLARSIGLALVIALLADWMLARRWRAVLLCALGAALTSGAWLVWTVRAPRLPAGQSYIADALYKAPTLASPAAADAKVSERGPTPLWPLVAERVTTNVPGYLTGQLPTALAEPTLRGTKVDNVLWLVLFLVAGIAGFAYLARQQRLVVLYVVVYTGVLLAWPYGLLRFLAPVLPLLVLALFVGLWLAGRRWLPSRVAWAGVWGIAALLTIGAVRADAARLQLTSACDRQGDALPSPTCSSAAQRDFVAAMDTAHRLAAPGATLLTAKAPAVFQRTGRQSVRQAEALLVRDPSAFVAYLRSHHVELVILSHMHIAQWGLAPMLAARCRDFAVVATYPTRAAVLKLLPSPTTSDEACDAIRAWASIDWGTNVERSSIGIW